jgi:hypothetical protein
VLSPGRVVSLSFAQKPLETGDDQLAGRDIEVGLG